MQPMGRRHMNFPSKKNIPKHRGGNWWEDENNDGNKATDRQAAKMDIEERLNESLLSYRQTICSKINKTEIGMG